MFARTVAIALATMAFAACSTLASGPAVTDIESTPQAPCLRAPVQPSWISPAFAPDVAHDAFVLHFDRYISADAIRFRLLRDDKQLVVPTPIRALGSTGFPASLNEFCRHDDAGSNYRFAVDESRLAPGFYRLAIDTPETTGVMARSIPVYIAPRPDRQAVLEVGQRYVVLPVENIVYRDDRGDAIPWSAISLHVAHIIAVDSETTTLAVDGTRYHLRENRTGKSADLLGLAAIVDDAGQGRMEAWYGGKRIWERGELRGLCASLPTSAMPWPTGVVSIGRVYRVEIPFYDLALGHGMGGNGAIWNSLFESSSPLLVTLGVKNPSRVGPRCADWYGLFPDDWAMQRALSTVSPHTAHPDWSRHILEDVDDGIVENGMTRDMVAWSLGYPSYVGSVKELDGLAEWQYDDAPSETYYVIFGDDGRVQQFGTDPHALQTPF